MRTGDQISERLLVLLRDYYAGTHEVARRLPYLALVRATLRRRGSFRKPMPWCSLALTQDRIMKSFSLPWKASTLAISTSCKGRRGGGG